MDSSYKQKKPWMNSRGGNNGSSDNWGGFQSGRDSGPERSSLSLAGWSPYADTSRRPVASNDFQAPAPERSGTRWNRAQSEWNEMRGGGGPQAGHNSWSGPSSGGKWSDSRIMRQQQQQQPEHMHGDIMEPPQGQMEGFLHGFNSAGRDWFYRYLEMGCSPEDARDRVLARNRNHPEPLDSSSHPDERYADDNAQVERRNTSGGRRRSPESRPETSSIDLTGLSGASRKWFNRHLANGFGPEEALAMVLEYKKNNQKPQSVQSSTPIGAIGGRKRPVDDKAREDPKKPRKAKEFPPAAAGGSNRNRLMTVAVVAENHPQHVLQKQQLKKIEDALTEEMIKGWTRSLNFGGIRYRAGMLLVTCLDKGSKEWLEMMVPKITAIKGVSLRIYKEDEIPGTKGITVFLPHTIEEPDEVTLSFIKEQNTDLLSQNWTLARTFKAQTGKILTICLGEKSMALLVKRGMSISYRFGQLSCRTCKAPLYAHARKKKATKETPKSPLEIDLTEEDGDMEISDMTVLDEVHGDDEDDEGWEDIAENGAAVEAETEAVEEDDAEAVEEDDSEENIIKAIEEEFGVEDEQ